MSNPIHFIVSGRQENLSDVLRDFKKYTSSQLISAIRNTPRESRRYWMLDIFRRQCEMNSRNALYQFWRQDNQPQELYSVVFIFQKTNYIHQNAVEAGLVARPEEYLYSSAKDYVLTLNEDCLILYFYEKKYFQS